MDHRDKPGDDGSGGRGVTITLPGGLLALASNSGNLSQTRFSVVPELSLKAGYQVAPQWRIIAGYDLLYWTDVQRRRRHGNLRKPGGDGV